MKKIKKKLLEAGEINIPFAHSFGGLKAWAYLAAIARDEANGQSILNKIKNINLFHPLPSSEAKNIKEYFGNWFIGSLELMFKFHKRPSIIDYIEDIKKEDCKLPNAIVVHRYAELDDMVQNDPEYPKQVAEAFINSSNQSIVSEYLCFCHNCEHNDIPIPGSRKNVAYTHEDLLKNAMERKLTECKPLAILKRYNIIPSDNSAVVTNKVESTPEYFSFYGSFGPNEPNAQTNKNQDSNFSFTKGSFGTGPKKGENITNSPLKIRPSQLSDGNSNKTPCF